MENIKIDFKNGTVETNNNRYILSSAEGFKLVSDAWLRAGWDAKYVYGFTYIGRPIIQQPEDIIRVQELIWKIKPDLIIETGIAHGGSLILYASMLALLDYSEGYSYDDLSGRQAIGIDVEIREHNRNAIKEHPLTKLIQIIEGSSIDSNVIKAIKNIVNRCSVYYKHKQVKYPVVMVFLDSNHTYEHVLSELNAYSQFVSIGSYIIACDGYIKELVGEDNAPRSESDWVSNNPMRAAEEFVKNNPNFIIEEPELLFNEGTVNRWVSYFLGGIIKRIK